MIKRFTQSMFCLVFFISLTACGGGSSATDQNDAAAQESSSPQTVNQSSIDTLELDPSINENIIINIVADAEGTPFYGAYVEWKETYTNTPQEFIDAVCIEEEECTQWMIDQFPEGTITVTATKFAEWENDPSCHYIFEGTVYIDTTIEEVQEVSILVEQLPSVCE